MGINLGISSPTPIQLALTQLQNFLNNLNTQMVNEATAVFNLIWYNPDKINCSPDKMIAALGTNAVTLMNANAAIQALLNAAAPGSINLVIPTGWTLTPNSDGSATATYAAS
jgi:hypothetical protein